MLFVKTELRPSTIHGVGTFLLEPVKKGQLMWRFDPRIDRTYTQAEVDGTNEVFQILIDDYGRWDEKRQLWLLCGDEMRYTNHADDPLMASTGGPFGDDLAARDLKAGEELSVDYRVICDKTRSNGVL
jgi:uncharacterized protein